MERKLLFILREERFSVNEKKESNREDVKTKSTGKDYLCWGDGSEPIGAGNGAANEQAIIQFDWLSGWLLDCQSVAQVSVLTSRRRCFRPDSSHLAPLAKVESLPVYLVFLKDIALLMCVVENERAFFLETKIANVDSDIQIQSVDLQIIGK